MSRDASPSRIGADDSSGAADAADAADVSGSTFMRGLAIGTLIGAAIAGSALWEQLRGRRARDEADRAGGPPSGPRGGHSRPSKGPDQTS